MKQFYALKLAKALESGEFLKGKSNLARETRTGATRYCCLGIACEIENVNATQSEKDRLWHYQDGPHPTSSQLPGKIMRKYGLDNPLITATEDIYDQQGNLLMNKGANLASLNDQLPNTQESFNKIARVLRTGWEHLT